MLKLRLNFVLLATIAGLLAFPAQAAPLSTSEMVLLLREAKVVSPTSRLDVLHSDQEVTVITKRSAKMLDDDCKIKAVLMAKALMDAQPKQLASVKVIYTLDGDSSVSRVVVGAGDIHAFANGTITEKQLLASLDLTTESTEGADSDKTSVAPGPLKEKRMVLRSRIEALKQGGTGIKPFQKLFDEIEDLSKAGKAKEASALISELSSKISTQESLRDQAKRTSAGRGVKGQQGSTPVVAAGPQQGWKPGNNFNDANKQKMIQEKVACLRSHLQQMQNSGVSCGEFYSRISGAERQCSSSPEAAIASLTRIESEMRSMCPSKW
jgi:hypothetical protein